MVKKLWRTPNLKGWGIVVVLYILFLLAWGLGLFGEGR